MAAVYLVAVHNVTNPAQLAEYGVAAGPTFTSGEVIAADESTTTLEGDPRTRTVILRFESKEAALEWYDSEGYQAALPLRLGATSDGWTGLVTAFG